MTIARKLKLNTLIVAVLLVANAAIAVFLVQRILNDARQMAEVEEPLEEAVLEMEINAGETARAVQSYVLNHDDADIDLVHDSERDFEQYANEFTRLAETAEERALRVQVASIYEEFIALGDEITSKSKQRFDDLLEHRIRVTAIDELIDQELQATIDSSSTGAYDKLEYALEMEINIDEALAGIESYVIQPENELLKTITDSLLDFQRYESLYRGRARSVNDRGILDRID